MKYFDHTASSKPFKEVIDIFSQEAATHFANPASLHQLGFLGEEKIKKAKLQLSKILNCLSEELIFTSGATESINQALISYARTHQGGGQTLLTLETEHKASLQSAKEAIKFWKNGKILYIPINQKGEINWAELASLMTSDIGLISFSAVNNNVGNVHLIEKMVFLRDKYCPKAKIHVDYVQALSKYPVSLQKSGVDMASFSGHKVKGLKGIGLLYVRKNLRLESYIHGAGQQDNRRSGTQNPPLILALAKAVELSEKQRIQAFSHVQTLKKLFLDTLIQEGMQLHQDFEIQGAENLDEALDATKLSPFILNISFVGVKAETLVNALSEEDFYISTQSSCSSKTDINYVLEAMGVEEALNRSSVRISFALENTVQDTEELAKTVVKWIKMLNLKVKK